MIVKQFREKHVEKLSIQNFSKNKIFYTCRKQCPCLGKASGNAYSGLWVAITIKIHVFLLENQGKSLIFHGFPCQNFFWTAAMLTTASQSHNLRFFEILEHSSKIQREMLRIYRIKLVNTLYLPCLFEKSRKISRYDFEIL